MTRDEEVWRNHVYLAVVALHKALMTETPGAAFDYIQEAKAHLEQADAECWEVQKGG